jgi:hypothetical protein
MTEAEWTSCNNPEPMLDFLRGKVSDRKLRLFACACCRRIWHLLSDERSRKAIEFMERQVDRCPDTVALAHAKNEAHAAAGGLDHRRVATVPARWGAMAKSWAAGAASNVLQESLVWGYANASEIAAWTAASASAVAVKFFARTQRAAGRPAAKRERSVQCCLLRDIIGNPFQSATIDSRFLASNVVSLARHIYEDRAFHDMPTLADTLEASGCFDHDILNHCREGQPHVLGCWVLDTILGQG